MKGKDIPDACHMNESVKTKVCLQGYMLVLFKKLAE